MPRLKVRVSGYQVRGSMKKGYRGYVFSRPFMGQRQPSHIQNIVIRDYCRRYGLEYLLSATEYAMPHSFLLLYQTLDELPDLLWGETVVRTTVRTTFETIF